MNETLYRKVGRRVAVGSNDGLGPL